ncbi:glycosyl-4,4'-diaponeurosporenoate acyltransferase CrtO family protein [Flavobacterium hydrophilum]|uniref:glycosyl-4,4'-diaponeurosporenoate acyltransferase CrtO family protein n=1 Tax=Flavobacterium hydrophilum TaxID=2211445 RepID=UPI0037447747
MIKFTFAESLWLLVLNIIFNVYPILLQRYNRPRLRRALALFRYKAEQSANN